MFLFREIDTVLYQFLETRTSDRCPIGIVQNLKISGFILYPISFFIYRPFKMPLLPDTHSWADKERNGYSAPEHG